MSQEIISTKDQERAALKKIANIVKGLGENSYVATALEGCLEIAEQNIEYDAADSYKGRWECSEKKIDELYTKLRSMEEIVQKNKARVEELEAKLEKTVSESDRKIFIALLCEKGKELNREIDESADKIVETAENPDCQEFKSAVSWNRGAKKELDQIREILDRVAK